MLSVRSGEGGGGGGGGCTFEIKRGLVLHFWKDIMKIEEKQ